MEIAIQVTLVIVNYCMGSISSAIIVSKYIKKVDIRNIGHKTAGGSNVAYNVGVFWGIMVGLFDAVKGIPVLILAKYLEVDLLWQGIIGVAAVVGHCWPLWFHFSGGRGIAAFLGMTLFLYPSQAIYSLLLFIITIIPVIVRKMFNYEMRLLSSPVLTMISIILFLYLSSQTTGSSDDVMALLLLIVIVIRRLSAHPQEYAKKHPGKLFLSRLIFDSDTDIT